MLRPGESRFVLLRDVQKKFIAPALCNQLNAGRQSTGISACRKCDCRMTASIDPWREDGVSPRSNGLAVDYGRECHFGEPGLCGSCGCNDEVQLFKDLSHHRTELEQCLDRSAVICGGHSCARIRLH